MKRLNLFYSSSGDSQTRQRVKRIGIGFALALMGWPAIGQKAFSPRWTINYGSRLNAVAATREVFAAAGTAGVTLWDTFTGKVMSTYPLPSTVVYSLAFSPDGHLLAAGCGDGLVRVWSLQGKRGTEWRASAASVLAVAFAPDSRTLASAGADQEIRLWDTHSMRLFRSLKGHVASVFALAFDAEGKFLASGDADGLVLLWDHEKGTLRSEWRIHHDVVSTLAFVPQTHGLVSGGWDGNLLWTDTTTGTTEVLARTSMLVHAVAVHAHQMAVAFSDGTKGGALRFWHLPSRTPLLSLDSFSFRSVAYFGEEGAVIAGSPSGEMRVWSLTPKTPTPLGAEASSGNILRWTEVEAIGYEIQLTSNLPFRETATSIITRSTEWTPAEGFANGEVLYWRVRSLGFGSASDWSEIRSLRFQRDGTLRSAVRLKASEKSVQVGDEFHVLVTAENTPDLAGFELSVTIEPPWVTVLEVIGGNALRSDGAETFWNIPVVVADATWTRISEIAEARLHAKGIDIQNGTLMTLRAKALRAGEVTFRIENLRLVSGEGKPLDADVSSLHLSIVTRFLAGDVNRDGIVDVLDLVFVAQRFGQNDDFQADVNGDGVVNILDLSSIVRQFGEGSRPVTAAPSKDTASARRFLRETLERLPSSERTTPEWEHVLNFLNEHDAPFVVLEPNYPNPFNPETWIPFRLGERAHVNMTIWDLEGNLVRRLEEREREAGFHVLRWDGRSDEGTPCASGLYVIRLQANPLPQGTSVLVTRRLLLMR